MIQSKCLVRHPPGAEIYRRDTLSVYEVTGRSAGEYCSNLGLFARLFGRHESLYGCAVPQFTYYLLCTSDGGASRRMIGFFAKVSFVEYCTIVRNFGWNIFCDPQRSALAITC